MKQIGIILLLLAGIATMSWGQSGRNPFAGRWDITITQPNSTYPGWLEVVAKDGQPSARYQPRGGSVQPVRGVKLEGSHVLLTLTPASGNRPEMSWELTASGDHLTGSLKRGDMVVGQVSGVRAPELKRAAPRAWTTPEPLFNGKDLAGWEPDNAANSRWKVQDGFLLNETRGANLRTTRKFDDFQLHIEVNCPESSNSGIYLRGRYEIQLEYEARPEDKLHCMGAIYGFLGPALEVPRKPGQWESFDVTLVGRTVTIVRDGVTTIDKQEIPGITGGALDSNEGQPGVFYIQGDHTGGLKFRNITISVPKR
jgi:3-keto-disaccharide hydrolase